MSISNQPAGTHEDMAERRLKAFDLRKAGASYRQIGRKLGVSVKTAYEDVQAVLAELATQRLSSAAEYVTLELERLDMAQLALYQHLDSGDPQIVREWRMVSESRRKLLGLDQLPPTVEQPHVITEQERIERIIQLLDAARARAIEQPVIDVTPEPGNVAQ
jgi:DNA-binding CsgD family transcriptional regulator